MQQKVGNGEIEIAKVGGKESLADAPTKYVTSEETQFHTQGTCQNIREGRHEIMPRNEIFGDEQ